MTTTSNITRGALAALVVATLVFLTAYLFAQSAYADDAVQCRRSTSSSTSTKAPMNSHATDLLNAVRSRLQI